MTNAFVLCAGKGERLWPLSAVLPKCLWPIGGKPCVRVIVDNLLKSHIDVTICCLFDDFSLYQHEFRDVSGINFRESATPLGTAGQINAQMVRMTGPDFEHFKDDILVVYGDCLVDVDYTKLLKVHRESRATATLVLSNRVRSEFGDVNVHGQHDAVVGFHEKPFLPGWTWTGVAALNPDASEYLIPGKDFAIDVFPEMLSKGHHLHAYKVEKAYYDIGTVSAYSRVNELAKQGRLFKE